MQDPFFGFGGFNQGGQTRVIRRVYVSNDSPTQLPTLDPFLTSRFQSMLPTMEPSMNRITNRRFFDDDDDDDDDDDFPAPFPSKVEQRMAPRYDEYYKPPPKAKALPPRYDEYYKPPPKAKAPPPGYDEYYKPPRANPPVISGGYYGDGFYPPRYDPAGANPVNVHVNLQMGPQDVQAPKQHPNSNHNANSNQNANSNDNNQAGPPGWHQHSPPGQGVIYNPNGYYDNQTGPPGWRQYNPQVHGGNYIPNGYYNSQTGGGGYNPQVQGGNKVDGGGKITLGPEIGNISMEGGKAGGDQTGGGNYNANSNYNGQTGGVQYNPQVQGGNKVSQMDYRLLARKLHITWSGDSRYWEWTFPPESGFPEVAELKKVCWLEIKGNINASELSPNTKYKVYLVLKFGRRVSGLDILPAETSVKLRSHKSSGRAFLQQAMKPRADGQVPQARSDGWLEIQMGEFFNDGGDGVVEMSLKEVRGRHWKSGLIIGGIEIRAVRT